MKYRIRTDGKIFKVQYKARLCWKTIGDTKFSACGAAFYPWVFNSEIDAVKKIEYEFGKTAIRVREWRTV